MYLLSAFAYRWVAWYILPLVPFSTINSIPMSVNSFNFTSVFFKASFHANPEAERNFASSKW